MEDALASARSLQRNSECKQASLACAKEKRKRKKERNYELTEKIKCMCTILALQQETSEASTR